MNIWNLKYLLTSLLTSTFEWQSWLYDNHSDLQALIGGHEAIVGGQEAFIEGQVGFIGGQVAFIRGLITIKKKNSQ